MDCMFCAAGWHHECPHLKPVEGTDNEVSTLFLCCCSDSSKVTIAPQGKQYKDGDEMKDMLSTGRKRAAKAKPIREGDICEWAMLKNAGGGIVPIIGCKGRLATNIHHGPDKSVLNNDPDTNLHKICAYCHNRWHTKNDIYYGERPKDGSAFLPIKGELLEHDKVTKATLEEIEANERLWNNDGTRQLSVS